MLVDRQVQPGAGGVLQFSVDHYDLAGEDLEATGIEHAEQALVVLAGLHLQAVGAQDRCVGPVLALAEAQAAEIVEGPRRGQDILVGGADQGNAPADQAAIDRNADRQQGLFQVVAGLRPHHLQARIVLLQAQLRTGLRHGLRAGLQAVVAAAPGQRQLQQLDDVGFGVAPFGVARIDHPFASPGMPGQQAEQQGQPAERRTLAERLRSMFTQAYQEECHGWPPYACPVFDIVRPVPGDILDPCQGLSLQRRSRALRGFLPGKRRHAAPAGGDGQRPGRPCDAQRRRGRQEMARGRAEAAALLRW